MSESSFSCSDPPGKLEPNPDIGGLGVIIGFLGTAWFVVACVTLAYFFGFHSSNDPVSSTLPDEQPDPVHKWAPNQIDQLVLRIPGWIGTTKPFRRLKNTKLFTWLAKRPRWEHAFQKVLLAMCDIQLLTGTGILLSGYISLFQGFISAYHWQLVVYLAWFSNLTHIACLTALRRYLYQHRRERNLRLAFMSLLWFAMIPAMVPTGYFNWPNQEQEPTAGKPSSNARCFFNVDAGRALFNRTACFSRPGGPRSVANGSANLTCVTMDLVDTSAMQSAIFSILLLVFSFVTRTIKLHRVSDRVRMNIRRWISDPYAHRLAGLVGKIAKNPRPRSWAGLRLRIALYLVAKMYAELLTSDASDVYWLVVSAVWGTLRLTETKSFGNISENAWSFGQILPVILLAGPIITAVEALVPEKKKSENGGGDPSRPDSAQADHDNEVVLGGDARPAVPDRGHGTQQQPDAASRPSSSHASDLDAASTAQAGGSQTSTEDARTQAAADEAPPPETQTHTQQSAGDGVSVVVVAASQAGSREQSEAAHQDNAAAASVEEITPEQLRAEVSACYADARVMGPAMALACLQVLPVTAMIFRCIAELKMSVTNIIFGFVFNVIFTQPATSFVAVLWGLARNANIKALAAGGGSSTRSRRRDWRAVRRDWVPVVIVFVADIILLLLMPEPYATPLSVGLLVPVVGFVLRYAERRAKRQGWEDTLPVVEAGHELEGL